MNKKKHVVAVYFFLAVALLVGGLFYLRDASSIVNVHESIENAEQIDKLQKVMFWSGMGKVVLAGIPYEMLHFTGENTYTYTKLDENNELLKTTVENYPGQFDYFCGINPQDFDVLEKIEICMNEGAVGIKIYDGYKAYHTLALDNADMLKIFAKLHEQGGILLMPVSTENFRTEFENMMKLNPDLPVICSHYCLSSKSLDRLTELMGAYPNLYIDTSFGFIDYAQAGFQTITENHNQFVIFFTNYQDRILFATDNVVTGFESKDRDWFVSLYSDYISILTKGEFVSKSEPDKTYEGLDLSSSIQKMVFSENWNKLTGK